MPYRRAHIPLLMLAALAAGPASAQTVQDAARANMQLALQICIMNSHDLATAQAAYTDAGFTHAPEDFGGGEILHWYNAPADTVTIMVRVEYDVVSCAISTQHMGVSEAVAFSGAALAQMFPAVNFQIGDMENIMITPTHPEANQRSCSGSVGWNGQHPIVTRVGNAGQDPRCIEDGTAQVMVYN